MRSLPPTKAFSTPKLIVLARKKMANLNKIIQQTHLLNSKNRSYRTFNICSQVEFITVGSKINILYRLVNNSFVPEQAHVFLKWDKKKRRDEQQEHTELRRYIEKE